VIAGIFFGAPLVLLAALAALIPLALHLLGRARAVQIEFSAMRFVQAAITRTARRRRIENLALLILRMALFALLPLALALPFYRPPSAVAGRVGGLAIAILLDNSGSMGQASETGSLFEQGKLWALRLIRGLEQVGPAETVVLAATTGPLAGEPMVTSDLARASEAVRQMKPTAAEGRLKPPLIQASARLDELPAANKIIYALTDFQSSSFQLPEPSQLSNKSLILLELGAEGRDNLGIELAQTIGPAIEGRDLTVRLKISGNNDEPRSVGIKLLSLSGDTLAEQNLYLRRGPLRSKEVDIKITPDKPGWFCAKVVLDVKDHLAADNYWHLAFQVADPVQTLVVTENGDYANWQDDPGFFVYSALRAAEWIKAQRISIERLSATDLGDFAAIYLAELPELSDETLGRLEQYLKLGDRALVVFLPADDTAQRYQPLLDNCRLGKFERHTQFERALRVTEVRSSDELLAKLAFKPTHYSRMAVTSLCEIAPHGTAEKLLTLENGLPLLLESRVGGSVVYLFTSPARTATGSLPLSPIFPAFVCQASIHGRPGVESQIHRAGTPTLLRMAKAGKLLDQSGKTIVANLQPGTANILLNESGMYNLVDGEGKALQPLAINCSEKVIKLQRVGAAELEKLNSWPIYYLSDPDRQLPNTLTELAHGSPLWDHLLIVVLVVMLAETFVANLYRPRHGSGEQGGAAGS